MSDKDFCNDIVNLIKGVDEQREFMSNQLQREFMSNVSEKWFHEMYARRLLQTIKKEIFNNAEGYVYCRR
jgi:hypothetical protein